MATNPYTSVSISGYNNSPPPDDGSQVAANEITWEKHKVKLGDPLKTAIEAVDTNAQTAFNSVPNTDADENNQFAGSIAFASSELTISGGSVTATRSHHTIDTESDAGTDDLDTIATGSVSDGAILVIRAANASRTVVVKHEAGGAGQIHLGDESDFSLDDGNKSITLQRRGTDWYELGRSVIPQTDYILITDTKTDGTNGGANSTGSWATRDLNTEDQDSSALASVSSNQVTLAAGTYDLVGRAAFNNTGGIRLRWRNVTDSTTDVGPGETHRANNAANANFWAEVRGRFTITAQKLFALQYFAETDPGGTAGLGIHDQVSAGSEVYAVVELKKVG